MTTYPKLTRSIPYPLLMVRYSWIVLFLLTALITYPLVVAAEDSKEVVTPNSIPELFLPVANVQASPMNPIQVGRQAVQFNRVLTHLDLGSEVHFSSPRGTRYTLIFERKTNHASGNITWIGSLKDYGDSYRAMITFGEGGVSGRIRTPEGVFLVESDAAGEWLIDTEAAGMKPASPGANDGIAPPAREDKHSLKDSSMAQAPAMAANAGSSTIDVMILHTPGLASQLGSGLSARLDHLVASANQAYLDSGVQINLRLVHTQQVDYSDTSSNQAALDALTDGTGVFANISSLRNAHGADLVSLVRPYNFSTAGGCGIAWVLGSGGFPLNSSDAYSIVGDGDDVGGSLYYCSDLTFAHELGHNMGCAHDRAHAGTPGAYSYSYGYGVSGIFGTIMSYIDPEIGKFSDPTVSCNGSPCGVDETASNSAYNVLSLNNTRETVANFRASTSLSTLESPQSDSFESGIGLIRGWVCEAQTVEIRIDDGVLRPTVYGTFRNDTQTVCGDSNNGFGLVYNWNVLGDGTHHLQAFADGVEFANVNFTVTTLGTDYLRGIHREQQLNDFPSSGRTVTVLWSEPHQNFVFTHPVIIPPSSSSPSITGVMLESPRQDSFESGIALIRGWVCDAQTVEVSIDNGTRRPTAYGSYRSDTQSVCGDSNNGFGLVYNWNALSDGVHSLQAFADGVEFANVNFAVTTLGSNYLTGISGEYPIFNFPYTGQTTTVRWSEPHQNFVIAGLEGTATPVP